MPERGVEGAPSLFRRPMLILSAGFLAVIVIMAAVMMRGDREDGRGSTGPTPPQTAAIDPGAGGACHPTDVDPRIPTAAPPGVQWQVFKTMALPRSPSAGPLIAEGQIMRCYAHTPAGALMAAAQIGFRYSVADEWRQLAARQLIDGPGKKAFLARRSAEPRPASPQQGTVAQIAGFRFVTYDPAAAVIQLAFHDPAQNIYISAPYTVKWYANDWMLELQPDGTANPDSQDLASLEGYTPWGGV